MSSTAACLRALWSCSSQLREPFLAAGPCPGNALRANPNPGCTRVQSWWSTATLRRRCAWYALLHPQPPVATAACRLPGRAARSTSALSAPAGWQPPNTRAEQHPRRNRPSYICHAFPWCQVITSGLVKRKTFLDALEEQLAPPLKKVGAAKRGCVCVRTRARRVAGTTSQEGGCSGVAGWVVVGCGVGVWAGGWVLVGAWACDAVGQGCKWGRMLANDCADFNSKCTMWAAAMLERVG